jgi:plastocyanin
MGDDSAGFRDARRGCAAAGLDGGKRDLGPTGSGQVREFTIVGDHYAFAPASLTVNKNDLVKITFTAQDIPHSFTVEGYRIMKRAGAGQTVTFEFRADQPGTFTFYCTSRRTESVRT